MVREIRIPLDDEVFLVWKRVKGDLSWKQFFQDYVNLKNGGKE